MQDSPNKSELRRLFVLMETGNARIEDIARDLSAAHKDIKTLQTAINGSIDGSTKGLREAVRDNGFRLRELATRQDSALDALAVRVTATEATIAEIRRSKVEDAKEEKADRQWIWNALFTVLGIAVAVLALMK